MKIRVVLNIYNQEHIEILKSLGNRKNIFIENSLNYFMQAKKGKELLDSMLGMSMKPQAKEKHDKPLPQKRDGETAENKAAKTGPGGIDLDLFLGRTVKND